MPRKVYILTILTMSVLFSQEWEYSADIAEMKNRDGQEIKQFDGNVVINRDSLILKTDKAIQYSRTNEIHLYGNISLQDKDANINCNRLVYDIEEEYCLGYNNVEIKQKDRTIYCDTLYYWDKKDSLRALGNVKIIQNNQRRRLSAQELHMFTNNSNNQTLQLMKSLVYVIKRIN